MTALHVAYRPLKFEDVIGQDDIIKSLKKVVKDARAKTFIFTGPSGTGKTTLARILANSFANGKATVANIEEFDAATNSGADAVRSVANRSLYRAVGDSPVKSFIIDEAHRLSAAAWTALLKPIEEPPAHVYWMFCTTDAAKIPKTIKTRCLAYDLKPVSEEQLFKLLCLVSDSEKIDVSDEVLECISEQAGGSPRQALVFLEACIYCESANEARRIMQAAGQSREVIELCRLLVSGRADWGTALKILKGLNGDAESHRIVIVNYLASTLLNTKDRSRATAILGVLECFKTTYNPSDKLAPLLYSVGLALGMDR